MNKNLLIISIVFILTHSTYSFIDADDDKPEKREKILDKYFPKDSKTEVAYSLERTKDMFLNYFFNDLDTVLEEKRKYENLEPVNDSFQELYASLIMVEKFVEVNPNLVNMGRDQVAEYLSSEKVLKIMETHATELIADIMKIELKRQGEENPDDQIENYLKLAQAGQDPLTEQQPDNKEDAIDSSL